MKRNPVIMMCYKDRTWCVHSRDCSNTMCDRNLNEDEIKQATEWWGDRNFPVAKADFKTDECGFVNVELTDA